MDRHNFRSVLLMCMALLAGCTRQAAAVPDDSLITGEPCAPPCWQGLTPGQTSLEEAVDFLRSSPLVNGNLDDHILTGAVGSSLSWWWAGEEQDYATANVLAFDADGKLNSIYLEVNVEVAIGQVIAEYGPPTVVGLWIIIPHHFAWDPQGVTLNAVFTEQSLRLAWFQKMRIREGAVTFCPSLETPVFSVEYLTPELAAHYADQLWLYKFGRELHVAGSALFALEDDQVRTYCVEIK